MDVHVKKGKDHYAKGESTLKKFSFFSSGSSKNEDAAEEFDQSGKFYVMGKAYAEGADAYERAAELHLKCKSDFDAATSRVKAAEAAQKMNNFDR